MRKHRITPDLVEAIDRLIERADVAGWVEVEPIAEALGWPVTADEQPDGDWTRARLRERLR